MAQYPSPVYPTWGNSISGAINQGFEGIMQGMQQAQQQKMADLAFAGQTGYTPQDILGGQKVAGQLQQMGNPQNQPQQPPVQTPGGPVQIGQPPLPQSQMDMYQHFQNFLTQGKQKAQAGIADTQGQAGLRSSTQGMQNQETWNITPSQFRSATPPGASPTPPPQQPPQNWQPPAMNPKQPGQYIQQPGQEQQGQQPPQGVPNGMPGMPPAKAQQQPAPMGMSASLNPNPEGPEIVHDDKTGQDFIKKQTKQGDQFTRVPQNSGELNQERQAAGEWAVANGKLTTAQLRSRGVATNFILDGVIHSDAYQRSLMNGGGGGSSGKDFNPVAAEVGMKGQTSQAQAAGAVRGGQGSEVAATGLTLTDVFNQMEPLIGRMDPTSISRVNEALARGETAVVGDADASALLGFIPDAKSLLSKVYSGKGVSDVESEKLANAALSNLLNKENFKGARLAAESTAYSRAGHLQGTLPNTMQAPNGFVQPKGGATRQPSPRGGPKSTVTFKASDGSTHTGLRSGLPAARKIDPGLQVQP
jgi:hypothetical protein